MNGPEQDLAIEFPVNYLKLEKLRYGVRTFLSQEWLQDVDIRFEADPFAHHIAISVVGHIWKETLGEEEITYPADWWQAFKERWFPRWLLAKYPVKYTIHRINYLRKFPKAVFAPDVLNPVVLEYEHTTLHR